MKIKPIEADTFESLSITAKFSKFMLGDAEHYIFKDELGKLWDFAGCECSEYDFAYGLSESEANESNQGWASLQ